jgi:sterol desaturase/sphingolipid hydroxylase (fatty acid hydroxylase superfamily)
MDPEHTKWLLVLGTAALLLGAELLWHARGAAWGPRVGINMVLGVVSGVLALLLAKFGPAALGQFAHSRDWGLLSLAPLPPVVVLLLTLVLMDFAIWAQHVAFHRLPWLWRLHRVHHDDTALDLTTGVRFHPGEALVSLAWKGSAAFLLGAPAWAVIAFELLLTLASLWEHANLRLPRKLDSIVRLVLVTPPMHVVHHSDGPQDTEHNFGFFLSLWDRLFGTYRPSPLGRGIGMAPERRAGGSS